MSKNSKFRLLCLSNGHGEDIIAVRILQELRQISSKLNISALPLVGEGRAYFTAGIPVIGAVQAMPSGGFIYMVSSASVTGSSLEFGQKEQQYFKRIHDMRLINPQIVGFGISDKNTF